VERVGYADLQNKNTRHLWRVNFLIPPKKTAGSRSAPPEKKPPMRAA